MEHHTIALCRPIERTWRAYTAIRPTILVDYANDLTLVGESSILNSATIEVFVGCFSEGEAHFTLADLCPSLFTERNTSVSAVGSFHASVRKVYFQDDALCLDGGQVSGHVHRAFFQSAVRLIHQDLGRRIGLGIAKLTALRVLKDSENLWTIEFNDTLLSVL